MIKAWPSKDPDSNLRYYFDWREWLAVEGCGPIEIIDIDIDETIGEEIASLVIGDVAQGSDEWAGVIMVWINAGAPVATYTVRCRITAEDGTVEDASRTLTIDPH